MLPTLLEAFGVKPSEAPSAQEPAAKPVGVAAAA
jgi:hypothetical protein